MLFAPRYWDGLKFIFVVGLSRAIFASLDEILGAPEILAIFGNLIVFHPFTAGAAPFRNRPLDCFLEQGRLQFLMHPVHHSVID